MPLSNLTHSSFFGALLAITLFYSNCECAEEQQRTKTPRSDLLLITKFDLDEKAGSTTYFQKGEATLKNMLISDDNILLASGFVHTFLTVSQDGFEYNYGDESVRNSHLNVFRNLNRNDSFWNTLKNHPQRESIISFFVGDANMMIDRWRHFSDITKGVSPIIMSSSSVGVPLEEKEIRSNIRNNQLAGLLQTVTRYDDENIQLLMSFIEKLNNLKH